MYLGTTARCGNYLIQFYIRTLDRFFRRQVPSLVVVIQLTLYSSGSRFKTWTDPWKKSKSLIALFSRLSSIISISSKSKVVLFVRHGPPQLQQKTLQDPTEQHSQGWTSPPSSQAHFTSYDFIKVSL